MNVPENTISTYEIPTNVNQTEILNTKLNKEYMNLQTDFEILAKEKKDLEIFYQSQLEKATEIINELKRENEELRSKLQDQLSIYNKLLSDFSSQQNILQEKSEKITSQIEKINLLVEEMDKLKLANIEFEEKISILQRRNEEKNIKYLDDSNENLNIYQVNNRSSTNINKSLYDNYTYNNSSLIQNYQKDLEKLKIDNKLLIQENDKLCKDNVILTTEIEKLKEGKNKTLSYEYSEGNNTCYKKKKSNSNLKTTNEYHEEKVYY